MRNNIFKLLVVTMIFMTATGCTNEGADSSDKVDNSKKLIEDKLVEDKSVEEEDKKVETGVDKAFKRVDSKKPFDYYLIYCAWDKLSDKNKSFFLEMYDNDDAKAKEMYDTYFMKFNIIKEISHTTQAIYGVTGDRYFREQGASDIAVAYWREMEPEFLTEVEKIVDYMLEKLESPIPEGEEESTYFAENYRELARDSKKDAYCQYKFVKNALDSNMTLEGAFVKNINKHIWAKDIVEIKSVKYEVGDIPAIVEGYGKHIYKKYKVATPRLYHVDNDTPKLQWVRRKTN